MPDLDQITVNVTDLIPPDNFATVDAGAKTGTVYTKEQDNEWRKEVEATTQSGIKGVLKPNTPYDAVNYPYPKPWAQGDSDLYEKYDVNEAGVFPSAKKQNGDPLEVTSQELSLNEVQIWIKNGVAELVKKNIPSGISEAVLFQKSPNLFDKSKVIEGFYISNSIGTLAPNATSSVSPLIPVVGGQAYYLSGRNMDEGPVRFRDASGNPLKPVDASGVLLSSYAFPKNGIVYAPSNAVEFQFTTKFVNTGTYNFIQFEKGNAPTTYQPYGFLSTLKPEIIKFPEKTGVSRIKRVGDNVYIATDWNSTKEIVQEFNVYRNNLTSNRNVNIVREYLIDKKADITIVGTIFAQSADDIAPNNINGSYIGGNHGWSHSRVITYASHGKTFSDIGKSCTDTAGNVFFILNIIDANKFVISTENKATNGYSYIFPAPVGDLIFSNGTISGYTQAVISNLHPFSKSLKRDVLIDGTTTLADGVEVQCDYVDIIDVYDIYDLASVITILKNNAGTYTSNPDYSNIGAEKLFNMSIVYRVIKNCTIINQTFLNYKKLSLSFCAFLQSAAFPNCNLYINKFTPQTVGGITYDFRKGADWTNAPSADILIEKSKWENPNNAPDRFVQFDSGKAQAMGFVKGKGINRDQENSAGFLNISRKIYPYGVFLRNPLDANNSFSCQAFRNYQNREGYPSGRISKVDWLDNGEYYLMLDWNASVFDVIPLPKEIIGKPIQIIEKTDNVKVLADVATSNLNINVVVDSSNVYGYLVLKITK